MMNTSLPAAKAPLQDKKLANRQKAKNFHDSWWGKSLAGVVLGLPLCFAVVNSLLYVPDLTSKAAGGNIQLTMWFVVIIWLFLLSFVYLFRSAKLAWIWLSIACGIAFGILWWVKS